MKHENTPLDRTKLLIDSLGWELNIKDVTRLQARCIKKGHRCRLKYVTKALNELKEQAKSRLVINECPIADIEGDEVPELKSLGQTLYELHVSAKSWTEITEETGQKAPWVKASKYAKENELPYPAR